MFPFGAGPINGLDILRQIMLEDPSMSVVYIDKTQTTKNKFGPHPNN